MALRALLCLAVAVVALSRPAAAQGIPPPGPKEADLIVALPGQPPLAQLRQYSGYIDVDQAAGKSLFYYFVEAPVDPAHKPLVLWLNGGPGCSSFGLGAFEEVGPFRVDTDGRTLCPNPYSWTAAANLLFLESPVGVGFSYALNEEVYKTMGDNMTAIDSHAFLLRWFDRFPEYKGRDFFILGESYAGHYIPELAVTIQVLNKDPKLTPINLKGISIGNGILEFAEEQAELYEYLWHRAFISDSAHDTIAKHCKGPDDLSTVCQAARDTAYGNTGDISAFNVYAPTCHDKKVRPTGSKCTDIAGPCIGHFVESYLNQVQVQRAIHANTALKYPWVACRTRLYNLKRFGDSPVTMLPHLKALVTTGIRIWLFSGDFDAMVPVTATKRSVEKLQLGVEKDWRPWSPGPGKDVAGYVIAYKGLVLATVRGSGHMVNIDQPERGFALFTSFLRGEPLPSALPQTD
ncbi:serine carboxypeptidase 1-like isoform X2 [Hordeum vulgare subsp. vulgare]|uniref:Carboxypeptidase n=1 Tax=Hordeum vulgare subsp. vulgare TaxID=112509 RepID=A0A8I6Y9G1_HORVV|nr:serine carboxypeptidase 1-like isoform X2 [Hordeum vulgare subsp. vulgare]